MRFLIDGYNLMFARLPESKRGSRVMRNLNTRAARDSVIGLLARFKAATGDGITIFFDGSPDAVGFMRRERIHGVDVVFSYPDSTADDEIKGHLESIKDRTGVYVVSSDNSLRHSARRLGFRTLDSPSFLKRIHRTLTRRREAAIHEEPREKFQGPSQAEADYWIRIFSSPRDGKADRP